LDLIKISTYLYVIFFITAGLNHFLNPVFYDSLVPKFLPFPRQVHQLTGVIEITLPIFLLTKYRSEAALVMIIFLIAIYGANLYVWVEGLPYGNRVFTNAQHLFRLLLQLAYIAFAYIIYRYD
jgi:uncharacterized membrane protein